MFNRKYIDSNGGCSIVMLVFGVGKYLDSKQTETGTPIEMCVKCLGNEEVSVKYLCNFRSDDVTVGFFNSLHPSLTLNIDTKNDGPSIMA